MSVAFQINAKRIPLNARGAEREINRLIRANEPEIARYLYNVWNAQADTLKYDVISYCIRNGHLPADFLNEQARTYSEYVNKNLMPKWEDAAKMGRDNARDGMVAGFARPFGEMIDVNDIPMRNIISHVRGRAQNMIVQINELQIDAIQGIIRRYGIERGLNPIDVARYIRPTVGLTEREALAVANRRDKWLNALGPNPSERQLARIERNTQRYSTKLHAARAKRIARTEMSWAYNNGNLTSIKEYRNRGWLEGLRLKKEWMTTMDEKTCPYCGPMDGKIVDLDAEFDTDLGATDAPPLHPHCRCTVAPFAQ